MARFNAQSRTAVATVPPLGTVTTTGPALSHEGGANWARTPGSELLMLAVNYMAGEKTFYESAIERDTRYRDLVREVATTDPDGIAGFPGWLRNVANIRSGAVAAGIEAAKAWLDAGRPGGRVLVRAGMARADEPGEALAYWLGNYGRPIPKPIKRGIADGAVDLYSEYCVSPATRVLRSDLRWVPADQLAQGDTLVGFDEQIGVGHGRGSARYRKAIIEHIGRKELDSVRVVTDRGEITVSAGHQFVARHDRNRVWKRADEITVGDSLLWIGDPWDDAPDTRDVGYAAGLIDGEGWLSGRAGGKRVGFGQRPGFVWDEALAVFKRLGFEVRIAEGAVNHLHIAGGRYETMRFLGQVRPPRLEGRTDEAWVGATLVSKGPWTEQGAGLAHVISVQLLGPRRVVTMQTSTRTFIAEGYLSHNSLLKYDTGSHPVRFGDVIDLVRPKPDFDLESLPADKLEELGGPAGEQAYRNARIRAQNTLFRYAMERRHNRDTDSADELPMVAAQQALRAASLTDPRVLLDTAALRRAGMTWQDALSLAGDRLSKDKLWEALIPTMPYEALRKNLRNFDEAGVSDRVAAVVAAKLADPQRVANSRQFPYHYLAAYEQAPSNRWGHPLDLALQSSLGNLPVWPGKTLVLVDTSASMADNPLSARSKMTRLKAAAVFGVALAIRNRAELVMFASLTARHKIPEGASLLREITRLIGRTGEVGHGTELAAALRDSYRGHDRVVFISDMEGFHDPLGDADTAVPRHVPVYAVNVGGYATTAIRAGRPNRTEIGGLSDAMFRAIPLLEAGARGELPWKK